MLTFSLTVTDNEGATHSDSVSVTVNAVNASPTAAAGTDLAVDEQTSVALNGSGTDADGDIASYAWTQTAGLPATLTGADTATPGFTAPVVLVQNGPQVLTFSLTVTDNEGATHSDSVSVTVNAVNANPSVSAGTDQMAGEGTTVALSATAEDSDGTVAGYQWMQVSGPVVALADADSANASFTAPLVYMDTNLSFTVTTMDNEGGQATDTVNVLVYSTNPDDDADGMDDLWEIVMFDTLDRDGNGDLDGDGFTDLQEFQQVTNPLAYTLPAPDGLRAIADNGQATLTWNPVEGAIGYNLYWSTQPGVTAGTGYQIADAQSGFVHDGLTNGQTYYYVVTALSEGDESVISEEASAMPGERAWHAPERIDSGSYSTLKPQIAVNASGEAVAIWRQFDGVALSAWVSHRDPINGWDVPQAIETGNDGNVFHPQVAINDAGQVVAVWEQYDGTTYNVWANRYDPQSGWGTAERIEFNTIDGRIYFRPQVAIDPAGNALVVWQKSNGHAVSIWANHYDADMGWGTAELLEEVELSPAFDPRVAMDASGNGLVVWEQRDGRRFNVMANRYVAEAGWTGAVEIETAEGSAFDPQIAMDRDGNAVAVWEQYDGERFNVWSNNFSPNTGWGAAQYVEQNPVGGGLYFRPQIAVSDEGHAVAVWQQFDGHNISIWANRQVGGNWAQAKVIEPTDHASAFGPEVAMDPAGNAVVVWEQLDSGFKFGPTSIWSTRYGIREGGWSTPRPLETNDERPAINSQVGMDAYGNSVVLWWTAGEIHSAHDGLFATLPVADAGADRSGTTREVLFLDGSGSSDAKGRPLEYYWHQLSGPDLYLSGKTTTRPSVRVPRVREATEFEYLLVVTDADGVTHTDTVVVTADPAQGGGRPGQTGADERCQRDPHPGCFLGDETHPRWGDWINPGRGHPH